MPDQPQPRDEACGHQYLEDSEALTCTREPHDDPWHRDGLGNSWASPDAYDLDFIDDPYSAFSDPDDRRRTAADHRDTLIG